MQVFRMIPACWGYRMVWGFVEFGFEVVGIGIVSLVFGEWGYFARLKVPRLEAEIESRPSL